MRRAIPGLALVIGCHPAASSTVPPPRFEATVDTGQPGVQGLPAAIIQSTIRGNYERFRLCYDAGVAENAHLHGQVVVRFRISKEGAVEDVEDRGSDLPDRSVVACIVGQYRRISFPRPGSGTVMVVYPIRFEPELAADVGLFGRNTP